MIPVFSTGLHCDDLIEVEILTPDEVIPVFSTGLHCDTAATREAVLAACSDPGLLDRAPLRHGLGEQLDLVLRVIPVFSTGLHCDDADKFTCSRDLWSDPGLLDRAPLRPTRSAPRGPGGSAG